MHFCFASYHVDVIVTMVGVPERGTDYPGRGKDQVLAHTGFGPFQGQWRACCDVRKAARVVEEASRQIAKLTYGAAGG